MEDPVQEIPSVTQPVMSAKDPEKWESAILRYVSDKVLPCIRAEHV